jgi:hypothetical protein
MPWPYLPQALRLRSAWAMAVALEPPPQIQPRTPATDSAAENVRATA